MYVSSFLSQSRLSWPLKRLLKLMAFVYTLSSALRWN